MPGASYMVSTMSSISLRRASSTRSIGLLISRSLGSGRVMMCAGPWALRSLWSAQIMRAAAAGQIRSSFVRFCGGESAKLRHERRLLVVLDGIPVTVGEALGGARGVLAAGADRALRANAARRRDARPRSGRRELEAQLAALASRTPSSAAARLDERMARLAPDRPRAADGGAARQRQRAARRRAREPRQDDRREPQQAQRAARGDRRGAGAARPA